MTPQIFLFGCFGGGHHVYVVAPAFRRAGSDEVPYVVQMACDPFHRVPGADQVEGARTPFPPPAEGWSYLSWWDRQGDKREGSHTGVLAQGTWTALELLNELRRVAPWAIRVPLSTDLLERPAS